ncbi:MAG: 50S ribosomal protein L3 [Nanoarchaeota archaeon]|nr:50S ribosomal protein L3 [Nanoarchaeota archaeon]
MPSIRQPRSGSMQFWPRKRAKRAYARLRNFPKSEETKLLGFAGYKVGMTHIIIVDNNKFSSTKGEEVVMPVTIVECPPLKIAGIRFYVKSASTLKVKTEFWDKQDKALERKIILSKKENKKTINDYSAEGIDDLTAIVYTQPKETGVGKKKPELFELKLGGAVEDKFNYLKENLGKEILINDLFKEGEFVDVHAITKGKGYQGPRKRFGIAIRQHKSEKSIRNPASLGPWRGQAHIMWRVAHAGKMGFHQRTEYNKKIMKISNEVELIKQDGGFINYGEPKSSYMLIKGSIAGSKKRTILFTPQMRPNKRKTTEASTIVHISKESKQGK